MSESHPADTRQPSPHLEPITGQERGTLLALREAHGYTLNLVTRGGQWFLQLRGDGEGKWAFDELHRLRNPPPPPPTVDEDLARLQPGLVEGRTYNIVIDDCCVRGTIRAVYLGPLVEDDGGSPALTGYRLDIGRLEPEWGKFEFREVADP